MHRKRHKHGRRSYLSGGTGGGSQSLLEREPLQSKYRGLLSYNIEDTAATTREQRDRLPVLPKCLACFKKQLQQFRYHRRQILWQDISPQSPNTHVKWMQTHTRTLTHAHRLTHKCTHPRSHARTHERTHARTHARTHTHTHTHAQLLWMPLH